MGRSNSLGLVTLALTIAVLPFVYPKGFYLLTPVGIQALVTIGLSLLLGYAGQISLGHAAFYAIGAYTSGVLTVRFGWTPWPAMAAGVLLSVAVAVVVGVPSLRLRGHYLAMATLAFGEIVRVVLDAWDTMTGGPSGFGGIPSLSLFGYEFDPVMDERGMFYLVWTIVVIGMMVALNIIHSRIGRALRSIHGGEQAANVLGVPTSSYKVKVFVLSAAYASVAGSLYAHTIQYLNPPPFGTMTSILFVLMVIVGGMRTVWGALAGTILLGLLPEWLAGMENLWVVTYGAILLVTMMFLPQGVLLGARDILRRFQPSREAPVVEAS